MALKKGILKEKKLQILCLVAGVVLALLSWLNRGQDPAADGSGLLRDRYGGSDREYHLEVEGLLSEGRDTDLTVTVHPRSYTEQEAEDAFERLAEELPERILGENPSLSEVCTDLKLIRKAEDLGLRISWYPEDPALIDYEGTVSNDKLNGTQKTSLKAVITDGKRRGVYVYEVQVQPKAYQGDEAAVHAFLEYLTKTEEEQLTNEQFQLPRSFQGQMLRYRTKRGQEGVYLLLLGMSAAVLVGLRGKNELRVRERKRQDSLRLDYADLVSRFIVYLGAGLTVRSCFYKIAQGYEKTGKARGETKRPLNEELHLVVSDLEKGVSESQAYQAFGRRTRLQPYIRFCALLDQNRRNGGKNLKTLLAAEMENAFEERKNTARRKGEEAGTKLLLPLFMMLAVVMLIVMMPAMMSMA